MKEKTTVASKDDVVKEEKDPKDKKKEKDDVDSVDPGDAKKEEDIAGEVGTRESSITETRIGVKYDVCASLIKKDTGKSVAGPSCQPIPPLAPGPSFNPNMNQNVPAPFFGVPERHAPAGGIL